MLGVSGTGGREPMIDRRTKGEINEQKLYESVAGGTGTYHISKRVRGKDVWPRWDLSSEALFRRSVSSSEL
jgi:hypothetical protein